MSKDLIRVSEIFGPTIQGEGALAGRPTVFVRTGGCDFRCNWCDTMYAVDQSYRKQWTPMSAAGIFDEVERLSGGKPITITLSGGNPAIQPFKELLDLGHFHGYDFCMETQGSIAQDWFSDIDVLTLSPKPPTSGMETDFGALDACFEAAGEADTVLKIVIFDETDYQFARDIAMRYPDVPLYLQPGNHSTAQDQAFDMDGVMGRMRWLVDRVGNDGWFDITVLPQLHTLIWGNKRGV
jgi:7-carboxy-7-deazaguanine synthase